MRNKLLILRQFLIFLIAIWIFSQMGIFGFIDFAYFTMIFSGSILLALILRKFRLRGLAYVIEYTALITGFTGTVFRTISICGNSGGSIIILLPLCILPLFYGLCLSTLNGMMIKKRKSKNRRKLSK